MGCFEACFQSLNSNWSFRKYFLLCSVRFYLGVALVLKKGGPGNRSKDSVAYLLKGLEILLRSGIEEALKLETTRSLLVLYILLIAAALCIGSFIHSFRPFL